MIEEFNKFRGWTVLEYFLLYPNTNIHVNELAKKLKIGLQTAHRFCTKYADEGILIKKEIGNVHQFSLNDEDSRIKTLKKFIGPYILADGEYLKPFLKKNKNILSISLYGSFASGDYGDSSDIDILILTGDEKKPDTHDFSRIELKLGRAANVTTISFPRWRELERKKDNFFISIMKNNVRVWGNPI
ncbi:nucleotidyltransferase domain-containing protein [Candidatus Micrarchaeota archaeon]|nr:nucleotidyltransferase domain-containing protein [Candidatus Micrarchaeota archaeon]